jgi:hypothetical protein
MLKATLTGLLAVLSAVAAHGDELGDSWTFEVLEVAESRPAGHIIRLRPLPPGKDFPRSCPTFVLYSVFDIDDWSSAGRSRVERRSHDRALQAMVQANASNGLVRLGTLGHGFAAMKDRPRCEVASRALQHVVNEGDAAIVSFYDEP